ncbi:DUF927 domain-containing protein [Thiomicrospira microaerophila]|uniref:DUF927 domain-containing protein n=1 Tax=Thiomicrospira microaerophila TaxID=406020 RepID=UPI0005C81696|nr:DUF927 domain-containing protein [Thiomicrospira microaerophila]
MLRTSVKKKSTAQAANDISDELGDYHDQGSKKKKKSKIKIDQFSQMIELSDKEFYGVIEVQGELSTGTYFCKNVDGFGIVERKLSSRIIFIREKIVNSDMQFVKVSYSYTNTEFKELLIDVARISDSRSEVHTTLNITNTMRKEFSDTIAHVAVTHFSSIQEHYQASVDPGFTKDFSEFLIVGRDAIREDAQPHLTCSETDPSKEIALLKFVVERFPLAAQMLPAMIAGFVVKAVGASQNPIFLFAEPNGNSGKTTIAKLLQKAFSNEKLITMSSTNVGIERTCYSASDSFFIGDELEHYSDGNSHKIAKVIHMIALGGGRVKAKAMGAKTAKLDFKLSAIFLSNKLAEDLIKGTAQEEPVLSRLIDIHVEQLDSTSPDFTENKKILRDIEKAFDDNPGFLTKTIIDYIKNNRESIETHYYKVDANLRQQMTQNTLNGRNIDVLAAFYTANLIMRNVLKIEHKINDDFVKKLVKQYTVTSELAVDNHTQTLNEIYNLMSPMLEKRGYFAESFYDLEHTTKDNKVITPADKQANKATQFNSKLKEVLGYVQYSNTTPNTASTSSFEDVKYLFLTNAGLDRCKSLKINTTALISFCRKNETLKVTPSMVGQRLDYKDKRLGRGICFDIRRFAIKLKELENDYYDELGY